MMRLRTTYIASDLKHKLALCATYETDPKDGSILYPNGNGSMSIMGSEGVEAWIQQGLLEIVRENKDD